MLDRAVFWPTLLGISALVAGIVTHRREIAASTAREAYGLVPLGPVLVAAGLAAFAGEHFTAAPSLATLVPKWLPARLFIAYFVGVAHLAAAVSFVARRYVRWSSLLLAVMFALFVLLMDLPGAIARPDVRIAWSLAARQATYSVGALALFATVTRADRPDSLRALTTIARLWTAAVLVFYGIENVLFPQFTPGVPDVTPTAAWVPMPMAIAYASGILLIICGVAMVAEGYAAAAASVSALLMIILTLALFVPQFFMAHTVPERVNALNFVFDTLLFGGTMLLVGRVMLEARTVRSGVEMLAFGADAFDL